MTDTPAPADPLGTPPTDEAATTPAPATPTDPSEPAPAPTPADTDVSELRQLFSEQQALIEQLRVDLSARPANSSAPVSSSAPTGGPVPAAAGTTGPPSHALHRELPDDVEAGSVVRFAGVEQANGADPIAGYAVVLDVVEVDDETGGAAVDGRDSHTELVCARLDVMGVRLRASNLVDEEASTKVQDRLDAAASG